MKALIQARAQAIADERLALIKQLVPVNKRLRALAREVRELETALRVVRSL